MGMWWVRAKALLVVLLGLTVCGHAQCAQEAQASVELQRAKELFSRARKAQEEGRWTDAVALLRQAVVIKDTPGFGIISALAR